MFIRLLLLKLIAIPRVSRDVSLGMIHFLLTLQKNFPEKDYKIAQERSMKYIKHQNAFTLDEVLFRRSQNAGPAFDK